MKKRTASAAFVIVVIILAIVVIVVGNMIEKRTPSKKHISREELLEIYGLNNESPIESEKRAAIVLQNSIVEEKAMVEDGIVYLDYEFVKNRINDKFYWDTNENVLIFTTPVDVIKVEVGSRDYYVTKAKNTADYVIVKVNGSKVYVAVNFVKQYSNITYSYYEEPARLCITNEWNVTEEQAVLKKGIKIRKKAGIKAEIVVDCKEETTVTILSVEGKWSRVVTKDGLFGFVKNSELSKKSSVTLTSDYVAPDYTSLSIGGKVSLGWHMVTSQAANSQLIDLLTPAKGLNVVSPTWYRLSDNEGNMTSLADVDYVKRAHLVGVNVWAMVDDQSPDSKNTQIFPYTSKREKIINQLVASAIEYDFDGINIDFEYITDDIADDYIQFLRELSVKCRINGIILSVDDKVLSGGSFYYNLKAQGEVADYVIMMGYDEHWGADSGSGSVASLPWVEQGIEQFVQNVPASKVVLGMPFYTRIWTEDKDGNVRDVASVDMDSAAKALADHGVTPVWVDKFGQNYGEYDENDTTVRIWLEDSTSLEEKLKLIGKYSIAGMGAWRLGLENGDIWNTIIKYTN